MLFQFCTELVRRIGKGLQRLIVLDVHHIVVVDQNYGPLPLAPHHRPADVPVQAVILNGIEAPVLRILTEVLYAADVFLKEFFYSPLRRGIGDSLHRYIVIEQLLNSPAQMHEINFMIFIQHPSYFLHTGQVRQVGPDNLLKSAVFALGLLKIRTTKVLKRLPVIIQVLLADIRSLGPFQQNGINFLYHTLTSVIY